MPRMFQQRDRTIRQGRKIFVFGHRKRAKVFPAAIARASFSTRLSAIGSVPFVQQRSGRTAAPARFGERDFGIDAEGKLLLLAVVTVGKLPIFEPLG